MPLRFAHSPVKLRLLDRANQGDRTFLWLLRTSDRVMAVSKNQSPISFTQHDQWLARMAQDPGTPIYLLTTSDEPGIRLGAGHLQRESALVGIISFMIGSPARGQGLGTFLVKELIRIATQCHYRELRAEIALTNRASEVVLQKVGFQIDTERGVISHHGRLFITYCYQMEPIHD